MEYTIRLATKEVPLYFGMWSIGRFCELNGNLSFTQMQEVFASGITFKHVISLFLCGAEHWCKKNKKPFDYTDIDAADWIDETGGMIGQTFIEVVELVTKVINPKYQGIEEVTNKGEAEEEKKISVGSNSEQTVSEPA